MTPDDAADRWTYLRAEDARRMPPGLDLDAIDELLAGFPSQHHAMLLDVLYEQTPSGDPSQESAMARTLGSDSPGIQAIIDRIYAKQQRECS